MKNTIKISLKTSDEVISDLKKIIGKELICLSSYCGGVTNNVNEYYLKDYTDVFFLDKEGYISNCSITFSSLFLEDYNLLCDKIKITTSLELCKRENLSVVTHGIVISRTKNFIVKCIEIFGTKYENKNYDNNHIKVDMDNVILFKSLLGEKVLIKQSNQSRIIQVNYDQFQIDHIINETEVTNGKKIKLYKLQHRIT
jgi:hypothetical protein